MTFGGRLRRIVAAMLSGLAVLSLLLAPQAAETDGLASHVLHHAKSSGVAASGLSNGGHPNEICHKGPVCSPIDLRIAQSTSCFVERSFDIVAHVAAVHAREVILTFDPPPPRMFA